MIHATLLKGRTLELMARKKNVTFNDIAQYTHFSKTTISRYFNNPDSLTPENQQIISDALNKLNYKENKVAKILANFLRLPDGADRERIGNSLRLLF